MCEMRASHAQCMRVESPVNEHFQWANVEDG